MAKNFKKAVAESKQIKPVRQSVPQIDPSGIEPAKVTPEPVKKPAPMVKAKPVAKADEEFKAYSTYISDSQKKKIKYQAIERGVEMQIIVREALDEYFENHPL